MAKGSWWKEIISALGPAAGSAVGSFKSAARETMDEAQRRVKETTKAVIKAGVVFLIIALGFIYVLNGLGKWLEASNGWLPGMGTMLVGGLLILLGIFAAAIRR